MNGICEECGQSGTVQFFSGRMLCVSVCLKSLLSMTPCPFPAAVQELRSAAK